MACNAPMELLKKHECQISERSLLSKRTLIKQTNLEIARELKDALMKTESEVHPIPTVEDSRNTFSQVNMAKQKQSAVAREKKEEVKKEKEAPIREKEAAKVSQSSGAKGKEAEEQVKPIEVDTQFEVQDIAFNFSNFEVTGNYYDGLHNYLLVEVKEGGSSYFFVSQVDGCSLNNLFVLPRECLNTGQGVISILLRVAAI